MQIGTPICVPAIPFPVSVNGIRLSPEPVNRFIPFRDVQSNMQLHGHAWLLETSCKGFGNTDVIILHCYSQDYLKEDYLEFTFFSGFLHARDSVPIGSLYGSISNLVWFPRWLRHGAMDPFEVTPSRESWNERAFEFTHFNVVIRLSIGKQSALFRFSPCRSMCSIACRCIGQSHVLPSCGYTA